jgi:hypothetical protein
VSPRLRVLTVLLGLAFFLGHVRALPRTLEDFDSVNFALGVEQFDVSRHRPHPPGYPVYVALAKISTAAVRATTSWDRDRTAASGLAVLGIAAGTVAPFVLTEFWLAAGFPSATALFAAALAIVSPLFWFTASRPLSDSFGLVAAVAVQAALVREAAPRNALTAGFRPWSLAALAAGLLIGVRTQTMWLTGPLLLWRGGELIACGRGGDALRLAGAAALGALLWAVPLVWLSGGPGHYVSLLGSQGSADFQSVEMLATAPTPRLLGTALTRTFIWPWVNKTLADVVLLFAVVGIVRLFLKDRRQIAIVALAFLPYLVFHLAFQETETLRYALPLVVPIAGLTVAGLATLTRRFTAVPVAVLAAVSLYITQPRLEAYARDGAPVFRGLQDMIAALPAAPSPPLLTMHHQVWWGVQRALDWYRPVWDTGPLSHPGDREWLAIVDHWTSGSTQPVWFLTDLARTDIAAFDPRARVLRGHYEPAPDVRALMTSPRPESFNWWEIRQPRWMLGRGWSLTPELAGMTAMDTADPRQTPATAFVFREATAHQMLIGGRYLAGAGSPAGALSIALDGAPVKTLPVPQTPGWFADWIDLPPVAAPGTDRYSRLTVSVLSADPGRPAPPIALEQFDLATPDELMFALEEGWQEPEGDPRTGRLWRWTSGRSVIEIRAPSSDLVLTISGESPLKSFDHAPTVVVRAGDAELGRFRPMADFTQDIAIPAARRAASGGKVTIETDLTFVPAERGVSADRRTLGLRIYKVGIRRR